MQKERERLLSENEKLLKEREALLKQLDELYKKPDKQEILKNNKKKLQDNTVKVKNKPTIKKDSKSNENENINIETKEVDKKNLTKKEEKNTQVENKQIQKKETINKEVEKNFVPKKPYGENRDAEKVGTVLAIDFYDASKDLPEEKWVELMFTDKPYELSNYGRMKSFAYDKNGTILRNRISEKYLSVDLRVNKKIRRFHIHKLVAEYFLPKKEKNHRSILHINFNRQDNHYLNLKWATAKEVFAHTEKYNKNIQKVFRGKKAFNQKLKKSDIEKIRQKIAEGVTQKLIAKEYGISEMQITRIKRNENWVSKNLPKFSPEDIKKRD